VTATTIASVVFLTIAGTALPTAAASLPPAPAAAIERVAGSPARDPHISLNLRAGTAGEAIGMIAERARWSLTASGEGLGANVSLRVKDRPATEVLNTVLEVADLKARFEPGGTSKETVLVVDSARPEPAVDATTPARTPRALIDPDDDQGNDGSDKDRGRRRRDRNRGKAGNDRVTVGEDVVVAAGEVVKDVVATGGSVTVRGRVTGDAVSVGGSVTLEPGARVDGDAVAVGGAVDVKPGATLGGERTSVGGALGKALSSAIKMSPSRVHSAVRMERRDWGFLASLWWMLAFFVLGFLIMLFIPDRLLSLRQTLAERPWASAAAGVGSWFGILALSVVLAVTLIGIPLVPLAIVFYFALGLFGLTGLAWWTGSKLFFVPGTSRPLVAFSVGVLVFALIRAIPYVGTVTLFLATTVSGGAALLLLLGGLRRRRESPPPAVADAI
jgi:hypothetical protein